MINLNQKLYRALIDTCDMYHTILKASLLDTPLGSLLAIADEEVLYLLEFVDRHGLEREIEKLKVSIKATIALGNTKPIILIKNELKSYFDGTLTQFRTKVHLLGSPFQQSVWNELNKIPYGQTRSYFDQARAIGKETAYRAVANANGANQIVIVIPCHRIIKSNGDVSGYSGGIMRKKWLLRHEKKHNSL